MATDRYVLLFPLLMIACSGGGQYIANQAPQAFAGYDQVVRAGSSLVLDGRGSQDPDGNALDFFWEVLEPTDDSVQLTGWDQPTPTITGSPNFSGRSIVQLKVSDGVETSFPDLVSIRFSAGPETLLVANAGNNFLHPDLDEPLLLSSQTAGSMVSHQWRHVLSPDGQLTAFESGPDVEMTNLAAGGYLFALTVESDNAVSLPDFLAVAVGAQYTAQDLPQITGPTQGRLGEAIILRSTHSENGNWHVINSPENETTLPTPEELGSGATSIRLTFQARGRYVIGVTAASGLSDWHALEVL